MEPEIRKLTERIAAGDPEAFTAFYHAWFEFMEHVAGSAVRASAGKDESFRLDVVHDAMLRVIRAMPELATRRELERWLTVVVKSCAFDILRRERRRARREQLHRSSSRDKQRDQDPARETAELDEQLAWLRAELARLDAPHLALLRLRHQCGWTLNRIGHTLGFSAGTVDGRLNRLLAGLRARWELREQKRKRQWPGSEEEVAGIGSLWGSTRGDP